MTWKYACEYIMRMVDNISFDEYYLLLLCIGATNSLKTPKRQSEEPYIEGQTKIPMAKIKRTNNDV
jgi:hypothetical protein